MATVSSNLVAGKAIGGHGGGNGRFALRAKLLAGVTILGCAGALAFGGLRAANEVPIQAATGPTAASGTHVIWTGTCRAGASDCLPGDDDTAPGVARTMPRGWTGTCRAGSSDCLPDEDIALSTPVGSAYADLDWEQQERGQVAPGTFVFGDYDPRAWPSHGDDARLDASEVLGAVDKALQLPDLWPELA